MATSTAPAPKRGIRKRIFDTLLALNGSSSTSGILKWINTDPAGKHLTSKQVKHGLHNMLAIGHLSRDDGGVWHIATMDQWNAKAKVRRDKLRANREYHNTKVKPSKGNKKRHQYGAKSVMSGLQEKRSQLENQIAELDSRLEKIEAAIEVLAEL